MYRPIISLQKKKKTSTSNINHNFASKVIICIKNKILKKRQVLQFFLFYDVLKSKQISHLISNCQINR